MKVSGNSKPAKKRPSKKSAPKAVFSFRRHILPPLLGLIIMGLVFVGLNAQLIEARLKYHFAKPLAQAQLAAITKKAVSTTPSPNAQPDITIPRIGLEAPIIFEPSRVDAAVQAALRNGVDHYGGTANPGQAGNAVIFGHSSGEMWEPGKYKYAFTLLDKVQTGDKIIIAYKGTNYIYTVTSSEIIVPTNLSILSQNVSAPNLTLVTCSPIGLNINRLVVHAVQVNPKPVQNTHPKPQLADVKASPTLPGNSHYSLWKAITSWF